MKIIMNKLTVMENNNALANNRALINYRSNIFKLYTYNFMMGFYLLSGVLIPYYLIYGKLTFMQFMFLQSYYAVIILLFQIPFGAISDYISRKLALFLSGLLSAIATLIYGINPNIIFFLIGDTIFALAEALLSGTNESLIYESLKNVKQENKYTKTMAKSNAIFLLSMAISAPLGPIIAIYFSLPMVMIFMFFPYLFGTFVALTFKEPIKNGHNKNVNFFKTLKSGFKEIKCDKILRILVFDMIIIEILVLVLLYTYQFYLYQLNVPIIYFGIIASSYYLIQIVFTILIPKVGNQIKNKKKYLTINTIAPGIAYILIGIIFFIPIIVILILIAFGFGFSRYIIFDKSINDRINIENRATVLNTINTIRLILKALLLPIIAFFALWNINLIFVIIGALIIILALKSKVKKEYL